MNARIDRQVTDEAHHPATSLMLVLLLGLACGRGDPPAQSAAPEAKAPPPAAHPEPPARAGGPARPAPAALPPGEDPALPPGEDPALIEQHVRDLLARLGTKQACSQLNGCPLVTQLARLGRAAAPTVVEAYRRSQGDAYWRFRMLEVLGRVGGSVAQDALVEVLRDDPMPPARAEAALSLGRAAMRPALPELRAAATRSPPPPVSVVLACAYALTRMKDPLGDELFDTYLVAPAGGAPAPAPGAHSVNVDTRWNELRPGIWGAGELRLKRFRGVLEAASQLGEPFTRRDAVQALGKLRDLDAVPALIAALDDLLPSTRAAAQAALESLTGVHGRHTADSWRSWWRAQMR